MTPTTAALLLTLVLSGPTGTASKQLEVEECQLTLIRHVQLPARQNGVLQEVAVDEGAMVKKDQLLAQIDDRQSRLQKEAALREYEAAAEQAKEDVEAQAARAAEEVARAEYSDSMYVNKKSPGAINPTELRRQLLTAKRAGLQIRVAEVDFSVAGANAKAAEAKVNLVAHDIETRQILAPFDGLVALRYRQASEWVQAGEPVLEVVQMDKLRVQGLISAEQFAPYELEGRPVRITIRLPGAKSKEVEGILGYVSQVLEGDSYRAWAEIDNVIVREGEHAHWLFRPGMKAKMVIDLE